MRPSPLIPKARLTQSSLKRTKANSRQDILPTSSFSTGIFRKWLRRRFSGQRSSEPSAGARRYMMREWFQARPEIELAREAFGPQVVLKFEEVFCGTNRSAKRRGTEASSRASPAHCRKSRHQYGDS